MLPHMKDIKILIHDESTLIITLNFRSTCSVDVVNGDIIVTTCEMHDGTTDKCSFEKSNLTKLLLDYNIDLHEDHSTEKRALNLFDEIYKHIFDNKSAYINLNVNNFKSSLERYRLACLKCKEDDEFKDS